jgi:LPS O-antigen subunit length determinant protein (WzzB/FepE family)
MKKNNTDIFDDILDLRALWREKILILSISIIFGLLGYLYVSFKPHEMKTELTLKDPSFQVFEFYHEVLNGAPTNDNKNNFYLQFISNFKLNLLSLDNLETFVEESQDLDTLKKYLKSRNISAKQYFVNKIGASKEKQTIIPNKYFLVYEKKLLDGDIFINNYAEYVKKITIIEFKKNVSLAIEARIYKTEDALQLANLINLENPILKSLDKQNQVINEPEAIFYKGTKVLSQSIISYKKLLQKLENDQFNYTLISDKAISFKINRMFLYYILGGLVTGFFMSLLIIFLKNALKNK